MDKNRVYPDWTDGKSTSVFNDGPFAWVKNGNESDGGGCKNGGPSGK